MRPASRSGLAIAKQTAHRTGPAKLTMVPAPARRDRLLSLQALRAVAALLVLWSHSIDGAESFSLPHQSHFFHWEHFGTSGVDIFFVISGFIVSLVASRAAVQERVSRKRASLQFLVRRITRIFPLYWILTVALVLEGALGRNATDWRHAAWLPTLFLLPSAHFPAGAPLLALGWTLMFEMYFYVVLTWALFLAPRFLVRNTVLFLLAAVSAGALIGIRRPWLVILMNPMLLEFVFGCLLGLVFARTRHIGSALRRPGAALAAIGGIALLSTIFLGYGSANDAFHILAGRDCWLRVSVWGVPSALLVGGMLLWNPPMLSWPARLLVFLGDASFSIYLCTMPARSVMDHFWREFSVFGPDIGVLFGAMFCTAAGVGCYLLVERPLMGAFHNWRKPLPFHPAN
jgi:exopolysaccharide production protein ExoZ